MMPSQDQPAPRELVEEYLETFRASHPQMRPPSIVALRDGRLLFNGFAVSAEELAEMRSNLLRWHKPAELRPGRA